MKKKIFIFKVFFIDNAPVHPRVLMEMYNRICAVFKLVNTTEQSHSPYILQPIDQGISTFLCYYFKNLFCKSMAAVDSDFFDVCAKEIESFQHGSIVVNAIKNIHDPFGRCKYTNINRIWGKLYPTFMNDFKEFKILVERLAADVMEIVRELD